jgi:nucleotide-binding universal stress UspA family protein
MVQLQESLQKFGVRASTRQIQGTQVEDLIEECRRLGAELIIVGSHGHGSLYNLLVGSITAQVLKSAPCPVLVVPAAEEKKAEQLKEAV